MKQQKKYQPSISQIIWTDYTAFYAALVPIVVWVVFLAWVPAWRKDGPIIKTEIAPYFAILCALLTTIALGIVAARIRMLHKIFQDGMQINGRILNVTMRRDRGRVEYTYIHNREEYQAKVSVHRNKQTLALRKGERVILLVDRSKPKRAFIRDLYVK